MVSSRKIYIKTRIIEVITRKIIVMKNLKENPLKISNNQSKNKPKIIERFSSQNGRTLYRMIKLRILIKRVTRLRKSRCSKRFRNLHPQVLNKEE